MVVEQEPVGLVRPVAVELLDAPDQRDQSSSRRMTDGTTTTSRFGTVHLRGLPDPARVYEPAAWVVVPNARDRQRGPRLTS